MQNCTICNDNTHNTIKCRTLKQGLDLDMVKGKGCSLEKQFAHDDALTNEQRKMKWRHSILLETLYAFATKPRGYYHRTAFQNLERIQDTQIQRIWTVSVLLRLVYMSQSILTGGSVHRYSRNYTDGSLLF